MFEVKDSEPENLRRVKRVLVKEFEFYNKPELIDVLIIVDNLFIKLNIGKFQDISSKKDTLGEIFLNLISFEPFVQSNGNSD